MKASAVIRPPVVGGLFYPGEPGVLKREIDGLMHRVERAPVKGKVRGIISPHAGYVYSGLTAAHGYALLQGASYATVVVVSPSHQEFFDGVSVFSGKGYRTPLGTMPVNETMRDLLIEHCPCAEISERGHNQEHAIEVQLPFLQHVLGTFVILPIVIGSQKREYCFELGTALASILAKDDYLLVASTDLSHYHNASVADRLDRIAIDDINAFDFDRLMSDLESGKTEACGGGPTVAVMVALRKLGVEELRVVHRSNSGDVTGDYDRVVGYLSAVACA
jgi:hypothetical protein